MARSQLLLVHHGETIDSEPWEGEGTSPERLPDQVVAAGLCRALESLAEESHGVRSEIHESSGLVAAAAGGVASELGRGRRATLLLVIAVACLALWAPLAIGPGLVAAVLLVRDARRLRSAR